MSNTTRPVAPDQSGTPLDDDLDASRHRFAIGAVIAGRYRVVSFLGAGGMGEVYEVHDQLMGARFALKSLMSDALDDERYLRRFTREITTAIRVTHPNVCRVHTLIGDGCLLMEFVEGHTLTSELTDLPWSVERVLPVLQEVARGLDAIHGEDIAHRDLKPENIMRTLQGVLKIMDFGLARSTVVDDHLTRTGSFVGTPSYMAPEQLDGSEPTTASDIWSFGVIAYLLTTGISPFSRATRNETFRAIGLPVVSPRQHNPSLPSRWETALLRCLSQKPADRFAFASDFIGAVAPPSLPGGGAVWMPQQLPDLWTPGIQRPVFVDAYARVIGPVRAQELWVIAEQGIKAVEDGNFAQQVVLGQHVENAFEDVVDIAASGTYFRAEGLRLSAPLQAEDQRRRDFLEEAESAYVQAASSLPNDARPLRGLGRVLEVQGNLGKAEQILHRAKALAVLAHVAESATALGAAHERLRTTRHYVHCVLDMRSESPASVWNTEQKEDQLRGYVVECANLHAELMPLYQGRPLWAQIEWFMGLVFLAKAWASLGDVPNATFALLHALRFRVDLLPAEGMLSAVEHANLVWWLSVASHLQDGGDVIIRTAAQRMSTAVDSHDRRTVKLTAASVLHPILPPPLGAASTLGQAQTIGTGTTERQG